MKRSQERGVRQASARKDKNKEGPVCYKNKEEPACSSSGPFCLFQVRRRFKRRKDKQPVREEVETFSTFSAPTTRPSTVKQRIAQHSEMSQRRH